MSKYLNPNDSVNDVCENVGSYLKSDTGEQICLSPVSFRKNGFVKFFIPRVAGQNCR